MHPGDRAGARWGHRMVHFLDGLTNEMVLFGSGQPGPLNDVYLFTGDVLAGAWTPWTPPPLQVLPSARCCMLWVTDPVQNKILMFGGGYLPVPNSWGDTWSWAPVAGWVCQISPCS